jgi:hypothetical protein
MKRTPTQSRAPPQPNFPRRHSGGKWVVADCEATLAIGHSIHGGMKSLAGPVRVDRRH